MNEIIDGNFDLFVKGFPTSEQHRLGNAVPNGSLGGSRIGPPPRRLLP